MEININTLKQLPDNRGTATVGDKCEALWFGDDSHRFFTIEKLDYDSEPNKDDILLSLGFSNDDTVYDIGLAFHVIILK